MVADNAPPLDGLSVCAILQYVCVTGPECLIRDASDWGALGPVLDDEIIPSGSATVSLRLGAEVLRPLLSILVVCYVSNLAHNISFSAYTSDNSCSMGAFPAVITGNSVKSPKSSSSLDSLQSECLGSGLSFTLFPEYPGDYPM